MLYHESSNQLLGHISKKNAHCKDLEKKSEVTAIFHGPHHYISPRYYKNHPSVPTWNYAVVHVTGRSEIIIDRKTIKSFLHELTAKHELKDRNKWEMNMDDTFISNLIRSLVFFIVRVDKIEAKFKLSQNRSREDQKSVINELLSLNNENSIDVAQLMINNIQNKI